mgnify:CR=1 FL=1
MTKSVMSISAHLSENELNFVTSNTIIGSELVFKLTSATPDAAPPISTTQLFCFLIGALTNWIYWKILILIPILMVNPLNKKWCQQMHNALHPDMMTTAERLGELASILAAGLIRLQTRKSRQLSPDHGDSCLDSLPQWSRHGSVETKMENIS